MKKSKDYHSYLIESLKDPEEAIGYLNAVLEETDPELFLKALRNVAEAYGGMGKLSKDTELNREHLYKILSKKGNPTIDTVMKILHQFGFELSLKMGKKAA